MDNEPQYLAVVTYRAGDRNSWEGSWQEITEWLGTQNNVESVDIGRIIARG